MRDEPFDLPGPNRFEDLDLSDEVAVIAAAHQDLLVGLGTAFAPVPVDGDRLEKLPTFRSLEPLTDEALRSLGIEPHTFGPATQLSQPVLDGEQAVVSWHWETRNVGLLFGLAASDRHVRLTGCSVLHRAEPGADIRVVRFIDWLQILGQMGVGIAARTMRASSVE